MQAGAKLNTVDNLRAVKHITNIYQELKDVYPPYLQQLWNRGHCKDQGDFYLLKTIISFNSGKIKMKNSYNYYHITMKNLSVPVWDAEM